MLDGVDRQDRFTVLSTCEKVIGVVHDMKETKEGDMMATISLTLQ